MKTMPILALSVLWLSGCTSIKLPNGTSLSTPAEMKNVTMTADSFHADEISHAGIYKSLQGIGTMLGVGAFLP